MPKACSRQGQIRSCVSRVDDLERAQYAQLSAFPSEIVVRGAFRPGKTTIGGHRATAHAMRGKAPAAPVRSDILRRSSTGVTSPSQRLTTMVATALPIRLVSA